MANWLDRLKGNKDGTPAPLRGAPAVPRMKNYAALSGYAYEYVYEGMRDRPGGREYVFRVSGDRKTWFFVSVTIDSAARQGQELRDNERYAVAKLALFSGFDERPNPEAMRAPIRVESEQVWQLLRQVGIE